jgi:hypothetical protein
MTGPRTRTSIRGMKSTVTPQTAVDAITARPLLPTGTDERVAGFGVMGLPFRSGHYLAFRHFPASSFSPAYRSVWHRDPAGTWTFYATTPAELSCSRYFSSATTVPAAQCDITMTWSSPWSLAITIPGLLEWTVDMTDTAATRTMSRVGRALPERAWASGAVLAGMGRVAGPLLAAGQIRLAGTAPNGQSFRIAPRQMWAVSRSTAVLAGIDLGEVAPLTEQSRLADFQLPQRGICVIGSARFEGFDPTRHRAGTQTAGSDRVTSC